VHAWVARIGLEGEFFQGVGRKGASWGDIHLWLSVLS
jgi:hypothetical protein